MSRMAEALRTSFMLAVVLTSFPAHERERGNLPFDDDRCC